jgi:molybdate transport system substrate-binding protein
MIRKWLPIFAVSYVLIAAGSALAAEIKVLHATALKPPLDVLFPAFNKVTSHTVTAEYGPAGAIAERIQKGELADIAIVTTGQIERLRSEGRILSEGIANVGRVGLGIFVRKGAAKPDLSSLEAFRKSLSSAKSIAHVDPAGGGASGIYVDGLLAKLGLKAELASKIKIFPRAHNIVAAVVKGEVDFAFGQISEILDESSIDLAGPLPDDIQNYTRFGAGVVASSKQPQPAKALIEFLSTPHAATILKAKGFN